MGTRVPCPWVSCQAAVNTAGWFQFKHSCHEDSAPLESPGPQKILSGGFPGRVTLGGSLCRSLQSISEHGMNEGESHVEVLVFCILILKATFQHFHILLVGSQLLGPGIIGPYVTSHLPQP